MSLRAILSGSRVRKKKPLAAAAKPPSSRQKNGAARTASAASAASPRPAQRRQGLSGSGRGLPPQGGDLGASGGGGGGEDGSDGEEDLLGEEDFFDDDDDGSDGLRLDDTGNVASLAEDLTLRDVVQALRYARANMFDPVPQYGSDGPKGSGPEGSGGGGFVGNSTRVAEILNLQRRLPALCTTAHVAALLPNATATERETVALVRAGTLRKITQPQWRRGSRPTGGGVFGGGGSGGGGGGGSSGYSGSGRRDTAAAAAATANGDIRRALAISSEALGEVLVETATLEQLAQQGPTAGGLGDDTKAAFVAWLRDGGSGGSNGGGDGSHKVTASRHADTAIAINGQPAPQLNLAMADELVRAGFLVGFGAVRGAGSISVVGHGSGRGSGSGRDGGGTWRATQSDTGDMFTRPEDRTTLLSLERVASAASGSVEAVGGIGAVYAAGGGGARTRPPPPPTLTKSRHRGADHDHSHAPPVRRAPIPTEDLALAVPGHGTFIKLASAALAHLVGLLARTPYREAVESTLRERWDASGGSARRSHVFNRRMGYKRVPLSRTRKWKDFSGLSFDWVLAEALGAGLVELFDTGSVGRGIRLLV